MPCKHYQRHCQFIAPCCSRIVNCRLCHDEEFDHPMDRFAVKELVCTNCRFRQKVSAQCSSCDQVFGQYSCLTCHMFEDDLEKGIFHCEKCKICRIGGEENFRHCDNCGFCINIENKTHKCRSEKLNDECPICLLEMFNSTIPTTEMQCGHMIHVTCFSQMLQHDIRCPMCHKTAVEVDYSRLDEVIAKTKMPEEYEKKVKIFCSDCLEQSAEVDFHFMGMKCLKCGSYNTRM